MAWFVTPNDLRAEGAGPPVFTNTSGAPLEGLRVGDITIATLAPGESIELDQDTPSVTGRFDLPIGRTPVNLKNGSRFICGQLDFIQMPQTLVSLEIHLSSTNLSALRELKVVMLDEGRR